MRLQYVPLMGAITLPKIASERLGGMVLEYRAGKGRQTIPYTEAPIVHWMGGEGSERL